MSHLLTGTSLYLKNAIHAQRVLDRDFIPGLSWSVNSGPLAPEGSLLLITAFSALEEGAPILPWPRSQSIFMQFQSFDILLHF